MIKGAPPGDLCQIRAGGVVTIIMFVRTNGMGQRLLRCITWRGLAFELILSAMQRYRGEFRTILIATSSGKAGVVMLSSPSACAVLAFVDLPVTGSVKMTL